jgi:hypothetical protein
MNQFNTDNSRRRIIRMEEDQIGGIIGLAAGIWVGLNWQKITKFLAKQQHTVVVALAGAKEKVEDSIANLKMKKAAPEA